MEATRQPIRTVLDDDHDIVRKDTRRLLGRGLECQLTEAEVSCRVVRNQVRQLIAVGWSIKNYN